MEKTLKLYQAKAYRYRFLILWVAFLLEFMIPTFSEKISNYHWVELIIFTFSILAGINVLLARKYLFRLIVFLGAFVLIVRVLNTDVVPEWLEYVKDFILITYYLIIIYYNIYIIISPNLRRSFDNS